MSVTGSGRFRQIYVEDFDRHSSFSSSGRSGAYNPQVAAAASGSQPGISYQPGTGAEYMYQQGWSNRDPFGKPVVSTTTNMHRNTVKFGSEDDDGIFARENRSKLILIILLILVSILLLALIIVIVVLFATGVFTTQQAQPEIIVPTYLPTSLPPGGDVLVNRTFELQMYVVDQANNNFDNQNSFEYQQAYLLLQNALTTMITQSTLRDLQPSVDVISLTNEQTDLQVVFQLSIVVPSRSPILAPAIRSLFLSELRLLENQLNGSEVDRGRISVRIVQ